MSVTILKGNIVSAPQLGTLEITENGYLVAEDGIITGVYPVLPEQFAGAPVEDFGDALILQSFADLHLHAPQYPMLGTGIILLREIDGDFKTPVADNLVYQNFPAMVFGFPILLLATMAPTQPYLTLGIVAVFLVAINILLFRSFIFKKKAK